MSRPSLNCLHVCLLASALLVACNAPVEDGPAGVSADAALAPDGPTCAEHDPPDTSSPWIVVGTGIGAYAPLEGCQRVTIYLGPQGGSHVWGAFRAGGFDATGQMMDIDFTLTQGGEVVAEAHYQDGISLVEGDYEYTSVVVALPEDGVPEDISEIQSVLTVRLHKTGLVDVTDSVEIVPVCCEL